jgi:hypothetical protein
VVPVLALRLDDGSTVPLWCVQPSARGARGVGLRGAMLKQVRQALALESA